jgi:ubiquinone/menaquinone biosynthesis C-methylase UbiE
VPATDARASYVQKRTQYWNDFAGSYTKWERKRRYYQQQLSRIYRFLIPVGQRALELGCGRGDLLAALRSSHGVGVDLAPEFVRLARERHSELGFVAADAQDIDLGETFDIIILSDLVNDLWDVQAVLETVRRHSHPGTRVILNTYSRLWELPRRIAEIAHLAKPQLPQNWLTTADLYNLMELAGLEPIRSSREILWPIRTPVVDAVANRYLVKFPAVAHGGLTNFIVARPKPEPRPHARVTVVIPARNEAGNIAAIFERTPSMGTGTELIFVEGGSRDETYQTIERESERHPAKLFRQTGKGKGDAVRCGFAEATGELLMILDADMTVAPEDLPRFYEAWRSGHADFVNGVRLVYPMGRGAMQFFNLIANKLFGLAFSWLLGQTVKDTLCGTKVLSRANYDLIAVNRAYFGEIDPFGDFDLLFGAARHNLKIVDMPVRYRERTYGETNIHRWSEGWLLLRMMLRALFRLKFV